MMRVCDGPASLLPYVAPHLGKRAKAMAMRVAEATSNLAVTEEGTIVLRR